MVPKVLAMWSRARERGRLGRRRRALQRPGAIDRVHNFSSPLSLVKQCRCPLCDDLPRRVVTASLRRWLQTNCAALMNRRTTRRRCPVTLAVLPQRNRTQRKPLRSRVTGVAGDAIQLRHPASRRLSSHAVGDGSLCQRLLPLWRCREAASLSSSRRAQTRPSPSRNLWSSRSSPRRKPPIHLPQRQHLRTLRCRLAIKGQLQQALHPQCLRCRQ